MFVRSDANGVALMYCDIYTIIALISYPYIITHFSEIFLHPQTLAFFIKLQNALPFTPTPLATSSPKEDTQTSKHINFPM